MKISVVIPCYNSEKSIEEVVILTKNELIRLGYDYEFVLVNDNSRDNTFEVIRELAKNDKKIKGINLLKNFGQHNAIMAGLNHISGDCVIGMDDDLQTHPSQLEKLINKYNEGYDLVIGKYPERKFNWFRNIGSTINRKTRELLSDFPKNIGISSFWIANKIVCGYATAYKNAYPAIQSLLMRVTNNIANVEIKHFKRRYGSSNYNLKALIRLWSTFINFSIKPLRYVMLMGFICGFLGVLSAFAITINKIIHPSTAIGWTSLMATILILFGINFICLGLVGEYVGRLFMASNNAPQYAIREKINCDNE